MSFNNLGLIVPILDALRETGYTHPTNIQEKSIPLILQQKDLLACAQTGTGKTGAFTIPMLQLLHEERISLNKSNHSITSLILAPTRELAQQIGESIETYGRFLQLKHAVIFGGVSQLNQIKDLRKGVDILVATPGRLLDLLQQRCVALSGVKFFVLDEADRMLDSGFYNDIRKIISYLPVKKQTLLFSATLPTPIKQLANLLLKDAVQVEVHPVSSTAERIEQSVYFVEKRNKTDLLVEILKDQNIQTALVFTQMKHTADKLCNFLKSSGINSQAIHGNKSQPQRQQALKNFKNRTTRVLVATDIAARGIDIDDLTHVINYELPNVAETYVHRIGRTARAGASGIAISFCDYSEKMALKDIQTLTHTIIPQIKGHKFDIADFHTVALTSYRSGTNKKRSNTFSSGKRRAFNQPR